ncbi:YceI family protein [Kribbella sp. NPDC051952]|uniref:YceI family protein n=1 Tax=Kribbella sp. NPDC051952 TaxID=3154851 RepID=UPI003416FA47
MMTLTDLSGDYLVDGGRTTVGFVARHRIGPRVRGRFGEFEGAAVLDGADPSASRAWLTIRAASIETGDKRRNAHLSKAFLEVEAYPVITFVSTKVAQATKTTYDVTGELTIRGVTQVVTVPFELTGTDGDLTFAARLTIDRHVWQVNMNALTSALVSPDVVLDLQVTATRSS